MPVTASDLRRAARQYGAGLYRLEQGLNWANLPMVNDVSGAYLRASWRTRQWSADTSIESRFGSAIIEAPRLWQSWIR